MTIQFTSVGFLHKLQNQSEGAWCRLVEVYQPLIYKWLRRYGVRAADADDIAQDVLTIVIRKLRSFERERLGAFRCWLRRITVNCLRDYRRKASRHVAGEGVRELVENLEDPDSRLSRRWDVEHDLHVLSHVTRNLQREFRKQTWLAFYGTAIAGRRPCVVAKELGMTENAVCIAKSRVSARVREAAKGLLD